MRSFKITLIWSEVENDCLLIEKRPFIHKTSLTPQHRHEIRGHRRTDVAEQVAILKILFWLCHDDNQETRFLTTPISRTVILLQYCQYVRVL